MIGCRAARAARVQVARFCDPSVGSGRARDHPALCVGRAPHVHARHARLDGQGGSLRHVSSTGGQLVWLPRCTQTFRTRRPATAGSAKLTMCCLPQ